MSNDRILVYLADLMHDYMELRQFAPLGIGFLASYAKSVHGDAVEVRLFKSVDKLLDAVEVERPDMVGLSNYTWNLQLGAFAGRRIKAAHPTMPLIMGGPNIGTTEPDVEKFLREYDFVDVYCMYGAERSVASLIGCLREQPANLRTGETLRSTTADSCYALVDGRLHGNSNFDDEKDLDYIPSPYTSGIMDEFLDDGFIPLFETNRGCPYSCTYCAWGISALNKLRRFGLERVQADLDYVAAFGKEYSEFHFVDANFGILKRDVDIAERLRALWESTQSFSSVIVYWSKSASPHMVEIGRTLGHLTTTYVAFQSLDDTVLAAMKRQNIKTGRLVHVIDNLQGYTHSTHTDILVGSPAETLESHLNSLDAAISYGIKRINGGEIRMLPGTEMDTPEERKKWGIKTKYRLFEGGAGIYRGELVYELEETIRETNTMSEAEMIELRVLRAMFFGSVTLGEHWPLIALLTNKEVRLTEVLRRLVDRRDANPGLARALDWLRDQALNEFFETPEDIARHLSKMENRDALFGEEAFMKLNFGLTAWFLLHPEDHAAYHDELGNVLKDMMGAIVPPHVIQEVLNLCRERNYLARRLRGETGTRLKVAASPETRAILEASNYLDGGSTLGETLSLSIDEVTAGQIDRAVTANAGKLSPFTVSQIMQMFWGRCHMEPDNLAKARKDPGTDRVNAFQKPQSIDTLESATAP